MAMNASYRNAIADHGGSLISYIGLVDGAGNEPSGGDPAYARKPVTWTVASDGTIRPDADIDFDVPGGFEVVGWRGFTALTGGTNHGGEDFDTPESFGSQGVFTLVAANSGIKHQTPA